MSVQEISDRVLFPKLKELFGTVMANSILTKAMLATIKGNDDKERFKLLVDSICANPKFTAVVGSAQAEHLKSQWLQLV